MYNASPSMSGPVADRDAPIAMISSRRGEPGQFQIDRTPVRFPPWDVGLGPPVLGEGPVTA